MQVHKKCQVYVSVLRMALDPGNNFLKEKVLWLGRWCLPMSAPISNSVAIIGSVLKYYTVCLESAWCNELCGSYKRTTIVHCKHYVEHVIYFMVYNNHDSYVQYYSRSYNLRIKNKKLVPVHTMKVNRGSGSIAPLILNLGSKWR